MNEKITLPTIIQLLAIRTGDTRKQSEDFIRELLAAVSEALSEGEQVKIKDFGVFKTIAVDARKSVNVSTGGEHTIPAHRKVVFVPSRASDPRTSNRKCRNRSRKCRNRIRNCLNRSRKYRARA